MHHFDRGRQYTIVCIISESSKAADAFVLVSYYPGSSATWHILALEASGIMLEGHRPKGITSLPVAIFAMRHEGLGNN